MAAYYRGSKKAKTIYISCKEKAKSQDEAEEAIAEQERIVKEKIDS